MEKILGKVFLREYATQCRIGCTDKERQAKQPILIDIVCLANLTPAIKTDNRQDCVDYCTLRDIAKKCPSRTVYFRLLESLALDIAKRTLLLPHVRSVEVTIRKPYKLPGAKSVGITLKLQREEV